MRRRWAWPLIALALALLVAWADGRLSSPRPAPRPRERYVPPGDMPTTIGPARQSEVPPAAMAGR